MRAVLAAILILLLTTSCGRRGGNGVHLPAEEPMQIEYLEIVTPEVEKTCALLARVHGAEFGEPVGELGNARTARLANGGRIAVRAPMSEQEDPVVRPYVLVDDIQAAVEAARKEGALIAHPPLEIPGQGTFAIYILGGIQHGLWQK
jgi:predicted enzyme related to lactoylglutathione lyase